MVSYSTSRTRKVVAGLGSLALLAGGMLAMVAAPAQAASDVLSYDCVTSVGDYTFTAVVDTDLPATLEEGESFTPTVTATVTVASTVRNQLHFVGHRWAEGDSQAKSYVNGVEHTVNLTVPATAMPHYTEGPFIVVASGIAPEPIVAGAAGDTITVEAGDFVSNLTFTKEGGADPSLQTTSCVLAGEQDATVDTVEVVAADSGDNGDGDGGDGDNGDGGDGDEGDEGDEEIELEFTAPESAKAGDDIDLLFMDEAIGETFDFEIHSLPADLGTHTVDANGLVTLTIPSTVPAGNHTLYVFFDGDVVGAAPITILAADAAADDDAAGSLVRTGGTTYLLPIMGALALAGGAAAFGVRRRMGQSI